ncbi:MAG TPA: hypothetical protein V6D06_10275 [Trichocoleus sp.]
MNPLRTAVKALFLFLVALTVVLAGSTGYAQTQEGRLVGASPPLGALVRQYEAVTRNGATAYAIWTTDSTTAHQMWFRIAGGEALYRQRLRVYKENAGPRPADTLPPASTLANELLANAPTGWYALNQKRDIFTYYIDGDHRDGGSWGNDEGVRVVRARFENGLLYQIYFEDVPQLDDYDDLIVEVALVQTP